MNGWNDACVVRPARSSHIRVALGLPTHALGRRFAGSLRARARSLPSLAADARFVRWF